MSDWLERIRYAARVRSLLSPFPYSPHPLLTSRLIPSFPYRDGLGAAIDRGFLSHIVDPFSFNDVDCLPSTAAGMDVRRT